MLGLSTEGLVFGIMGGSFTVIGLVMMYVAIMYPRYIDIIRNSWKQVPATITRADYREVRNSNNVGEKYEFQVEHEYDFRGRKTGTVFHPPLFGLGHDQFSGDYVPDKVGEYEVGEQVEVYVNPDNAEESYVELYDDSRLRKIQLFTSVFALFFIPCGLVLLTTI